VHDVSCVHIIYMTHMDSYCVLMYIFAWNIVCCIVLQAVRFSVLQAFVHDVSYVHIIHMTHRHSRLVFMYICAWFLCIYHMNHLHIFVQFCVPYIVCIYHTYMTHTYSWNIVSACIFVDDILCVYTTCNTHIFMQHSDCMYICAWYIVRTYNIYATHTLLQYKYSWRIMCRYHISNCARLDVCCIKYNTSNTHILMQCSTYDWLCVYIMYMLYIYNKHTLLSSSTCVLCAHTIYPTHIWMQHSKHDVSCVHIVHILYICNKNKFFFQNSTCQSFDRAVEVAVVFV